jgi:hypothetical protein
LHFVDAYPSTRPFQPREHSRDHEDVTIGGDGAPLIRRSTQAERAHERIVNDRLTIRIKLNPLANGIFRTFR